MYIGSTDTKDLPPFSVQNVDNSVDEALIRPMGNEIVVPCNKDDSC